MEVAATSREIEQSWKIVLCNTRGGASSVDAKKQNKKDRGIHIENYEKGVGSMEREFIRLMHSHYFSEKSKMIPRNCVADFSRYKSQGSLVNKSSGSCFLKITYFCNSQGIKFSLTFGLSYEHKLHHPIGIN